MRAEWLTFVLAASAYGFALALVAVGSTPSDAALSSCWRSRSSCGGAPYGGREAAPEYGSRAQNLFIHSVVFSVLLAIGSDHLRAGLR